MAKRKTSKKVSTRPAKKTEAYELVKVLVGRVTYLTVDGKPVSINRGTEPVALADGKDLKPADQEQLKAVYHAGYTGLVKKVVK